MERRSLCDRERTHLRPYSGYVTLPSYTRQLKVAKLSYIIQHGWVTYIVSTGPKRTTAKRESSPYIYRTNSSFSLWPFQSDLLLLLLHLLCYVGSPGGPAGASSLPLFRLSNSLSLSPSPSDAWALDTNAISRTNDFLSGKKYCVCISYFTWLIIQKINIASTHHPVT